MDANIKAVRWFWQKHLEMIAGIQALCVSMGIVFEVDTAVVERMRAEIAELDKLLSDGFTHFQAIQKIC